MILAVLIWHVLTIGQICREAPGDWRVMRTHAEVSGFVTYLKREEDGDLHIRLCDAPDAKGMDRSSCIVAECIPALPCQRPRKGQRVTVRGVTRYDGERGHGWWEIHPVASIKVSP